jgi:hypothetical protein
MPSTRLHVEPAAPAAPVTAAAKATTANLMETATATRSGVASSAAAGGPNSFDGVVNAASTWASGLHQGAVTETQTRGVAVGAASAQGFTNLGSMDAENAAHLNMVG